MWDLDRCLECGSTGDVACTAWLAQVGESTQVMFGKKGVTEIGRDGLVSAIGRAPWLER
jgi:hypothetical protein